MKISWLQLPSNESLREDILEIKSNGVPPVKISWLQLLRSLPEAKGAFEQTEAKEWYTSKTIWYNLIKAVITIAAALGIYVELSKEDIETIGVALSVAVPAVATVCDALANIWLRLRTDRPVAMPAKRVNPPG